MSSHVAAQTGQASGRRSWSIATSPRSVLTLGGNLGVRAPADFFAPGSEPVIAQIGVEGLGGIGARDAGLLLAVHGSGVRLLGARLAGITPVIVTFTGGRAPERWSVEVSLSHDGAAPGAFAHVGGDLGWFDADMPARLEMTFTRERDGERTAALSVAGRLGVFGPWSAMDASDGRYAGRAPESRLEFTPSGAVAPALRARVEPERGDICLADIAPPFGFLDISDTIAFLQAFAAHDPIADFAEPMGLFDFSDVVGFLVEYHNCF